MKSRGTINRSSRDNNLGVNHYIAAANLVRGSEFLSQGRRTLLGGRIMIGNANRGGGHGGHAGHSTRGSLLKRSSKDSEIAISGDLRTLEFQSSPPPFRRPWYALNQMFDFYGYSNAIISISVDNLSHIHIGDFVAGCRPCC